MKTQMDFMGKTWTRLAGTTAEKKRLWADIQANHTEIAQLVSNNPIFASVLKAFPGTTIWVEL